MANASFGSQPVGRAVAQCVAHDRETLTIEVKEKHTHRPVSGAIITLSGGLPSKTTGKNGRAVFEALPAGNYSVTARNASYLFLADPHNHPAAGHQTLLAIKRPAELPIKVALEGGGALASSAVRLHVSLHGSHKSFPVVASDALGNFTVALRDGNYHLDLVASAAETLPNHNPEARASLELTVKNRAVRLKGAAHHTPIELLFPAYGSLAVSITGDGPIPTYEASPHPLAHVAITLTPVPPKQAHHASGHDKAHEKVIARITDQNGLAAFTHLKPGDYEVALDLNTSAGRSAFGDRSYFRLSVPRHLHIAPAWQQPNQALAIQATRRSLKTLGALGGRPQSGFVDGSDPLAIPATKVIEQELSRLVVYTAWATTCGDGENPNPQKLGDLKFAFETPNASGWIDDRSDKVMGFASQQGMSVNATPLLWCAKASGLMPDWIDRFPGIDHPATFSPTFKHLIDFQFQKVIGHYGGQAPGVSSWVVVNEACNLLRPGQGPSMGRRPVWRPLAGERIHKSQRLLKESAVDIFVHAFASAHALAPGADLLLNDYWNDDWPYNNENQSETFFALLREVRHKSGLPIAAGFQCHLTIPESVIRMHGAQQRRTLQDAADMVAHCFERYRREGIEVYVTEFGLSPANTSAAALEAEGVTYEELIHAIKPHCKAIYLWGLTDRYVDNHPDRNDPYLFDRNFLPKPAYCGVLKGIE